VNRKSEAFIREVLTRIEAKSAGPSKGHWAYLSCDLRVEFPRKVTKQQMQDWILNGLLMQRAIHNLAASALKELQFNGSGVFSVGATQGELTVDESKQENEKGE